MYKPTSWIHHSCFFPIGSLAILTDSLQTERKHTKNVWCTKYFQANVSSMLNIDIKMWFNGENYPQYRCSFVCYHQSPSFHILSLSLSHFVHFENVGFTFQSSFHIKNGNFYFNERLLMVCSSFELHKSHNWKTKC